MTTLTTEKRLAFNEHAINRIQDYFEYSYESKKDQQTVFAILQEMCEDMRKLIEESE